VAELCGRLDGIPLAIELAAARVRLLDVEQIAARLDDRFRLLVGGNRTASPRQQTLRAAVRWSYELLSDSERRLFERLAVFAGGWTLEAAERACGGHGLDARDVLAVLGQLVDKSLVVAEATPEGRVWYRDQGH
jgi:predicted ATPase